MMAGKTTKGSPDEWALGSFMVSGRTQLTEYVHQEDSSVAVRKHVEMYIVDRSPALAKAQFKIIYPGSTNIKARFIKAL